MQVESLLGHEELAWRTGQQMFAAANRSGKTLPSFTAENAWWLAHDYQRGLRAIILDEQQHVDHDDTSQAALGALHAVLAHDDKLAGAQLVRAQNERQDPTVSAASDFVSALIAERTGDVAAANEDMLRFDAAFRDPVVAASFPDLHCWAAPIETRAGHDASAIKIFETGRHLVDCARSKRTCSSKKATGRRLFVSMLRLSRWLPTYQAHTTPVVRHSFVTASSRRQSRASLRLTHADPNGPTR